MAATVHSSPSTIMPSMRYRDANAAIEWLCNVFGFEKHAVYPGPTTLWVMPNSPWAEA